MTVNLPSFAIVSQTSDLWGTPKMSQPPRKLVSVGESGKGSRAEPSGSVSAEMRRRSLRVCHAPALLSDAGQWSPEAAAA